MTQRSTGAYALLIGVDDYSLYDASAGNAKGTSDLVAGSYDVSTWYRMCRRLGVAPENIHVLSTPKFDPGAAHDGPDPMKPGYVGEATEAEIRAQLGWLTKALEHAPGAEGAPVGLFTYAGHGDFLDGHLALCPSDVRKAAGASDPEGLISFHDLQKAVRAVPGAEESLTVVLDCCHAGSGAPADALGRGALGSLTGRAYAGEAQHPVIADRVIMAASPGQVAYQCTFDGHPHGALTWALSVVTDQYVAAADGGGRQFTITHGDLRDRAQQLLAALSIAQDIRLVGPAGVERFHFFQRGSAEAAAATTTPDRKRHGIQLDPNTKGFTLYRIVWDAHPGEKSYALSVNEDGQDSPEGDTYRAGTEYWALGPRLQEGLPATGTVTFIPHIQEWNNGKLAELGWTGSSESPTAESTTQWQPGEAPPTSAFVMNNGTTAISFRGTVPTWYNLGGEPEYLVGEKGAKFWHAEPSTPGPGESWSVSGPNA